MFTNKAEETFFMSHINKDSIVLEYGSGESTSEIAVKCGSIVSMEHQKKWYNKNIRIVPKNCELILKKPNNLNYKEGGDCGSYDDFKDYIETPLTKAPFDIILIDGRARVACASICKQLGHKDTLVFIHDFERVEYKKALKYLELITMVGNMAKFKIK